MRSDAVVVMGVRFPNPTQMRLTQDNHIIDALAPDRFDQPFSKAILPRRGWCNGPIPDAHRAQSACDNRTIDAIPVADHVARSFIPRECFCDLARNPFRGRMRCDADPDQFSAIQPHYDVGVEQVETDSWNNERVHGGNVWRVVAQKGANARFSRGGAASRPVSGKRTWPIWADMSVSTLTIRPTLLARAPITLRGMRSVEIAFEAKMFPAAAITPTTLE